MDNTANGTFNGECKSRFEGPQDEENKKDRRSDNSMEDESRETKCLSIKKSSSEKNERKLLFGIDSILKSSNKTDIKFRKEKDSNVLEKSAKYDYKAKERIESYRKYDSRQSLKQNSFSATNNNISPEVGEQDKTGEPSLSQARATFHPYLLANQISMWPWKEVRRERIGIARRVGHPYQNRTPPKRKKPRTSFTRLQIIELEQRFEQQKYLASSERSTLAKSLKMSDSQVKTWFQNRRTKWRRQTAEEKELERQAASRLLISIQRSTSQKQGLLNSVLCMNNTIINKEEWETTRQMTDG